MIKNVCSNFHIFPLYLKTYKKIIDKICEWEAHSKLGTGRDGKPKNFLFSAFIALCYSTMLQSPTVVLQ